MEPQSATSSVQYTLRGAMISVEQLPSYAETQHTSALPSKSAGSLPPPYVSRIKIDSEPDSSVSPSSQLFSVSQWSLIQISGLILFLVVLVVITLVCLLCPSRPVKEFSPCEYCFALFIIVTAVIVVIFIDVTFKIWTV